MKLTYHADYALRVLLHLATRPLEVVSVGEIAGFYGVSVHHLAKVVQRLGKLGYVDILRGQSGGVRLRADPAALTVGEVVRRTEPSMALVECFEPATNRCPIAARCGLRGALEDAQRAFLAALDTRSILSCVGAPSPLAALVPVRRRGPAPARRP